MNHLKRLIYGAVAITAPLFISCSSIPQQLEQNTFYKRDLKFTVNGQAIDGSGVVDENSQYEIQLASKDTVAMLLIRSCHREQTFEKVGCQSSGLFGLGSKTCFKYSYSPVSDIETNRVCPLRLEAYDSEDGKHGWGLLDFRSDKFQVPFRLSCNGVVSDERGVATCQGRVEAVQRISFSEPIRFAESPNCEKPQKVDDSYEIKVSKGECLYMFDTKDGRLGRLLILGFDGILVRENP